MPYDWREGGAQAAKHAFFAWAARHPDANFETYEAGFVGGARWAIQSSSALSPAIASLIELVEWLRAMDVEERGGAWGESNLVAEQRAAYVADEDAELEQLPF